MKRPLLLTLGLLTATYSFGQGVFSSTGVTSDFGTASTWTLDSGTDADGIPDSDDDVNILAGHLIIVGTDESCRDLSITDDASLTELTVNAGVTLTTTGSVSGSVSTTNAEIYITIDGDWIISGTMRIQPALANSAIEISIGSTGTLDIQSAGTSYLRLRNAPTSFSFFHNHGTFHCGGRFHFFSTFGSDYTIENYGDWTVDGDFRLRIENPTSVLTFQNRGTLDLNGDLQLNARSSSDPALLVVDQQFANSAITLEGAISMMTSGGSLAANTTDATFTYDGAIDQTVTTDSKVEYHNLTITGAKTASQDGELLATQLLGDLTVNAGATFDQGSFATTSTGNVINNNGTIDQNAAMTVGGDYSNNGTGAHNSTNLLTVTGNYTNAGVYTATSANVDIGGNFSNSGTYTSAGTGSTINVGGDWGNTGTYSPLSGDIVEMDGTSGTASITGTTTFMGLNIDHSGTGVSNSGTVNIQENLDLDQGTYTTGGATTLLSNTTGTGNFDNMDAAILSGSLILQRRIDASEDGWREIASPFAGTTINDWQTDGLLTTGFTGSDFPSFPFVSVYTYDENLADGDKNNGWTAATNTTNVTSADSGNRVYIGQGIMNLDLSGAPNTGDYSWTLAYQDDAGDSEQEGWNLIGNPYPCTVDFDLIDGTQRSNIEYKIWVFSASNGNYGTYTGLVGGSGTNGVDRYIPSMQGFWVHATASSPTMTWRESDKVGTEDPSFVKNAQNDEFFRVKLTGNVNSYQDEAVIIVNDTATTGAYDALDSYKLYAPSDYIDYTPSLAFVLNDSSDLSIMSLSHDPAYTIPLKAYAGALAQGQYTLEFSNLDEFKADACIQLEDLHLGTMTDLRSTPSYSFASSDTTTLPRFVIHVNTLIDDISSTDASCFGMTDGSIVAEVTAGNVFDLIWTDDMNNVLQTSTSITNSDTLNGLGAGTYYLSSTGGACILGSNEFIISEPVEVIADFMMSEDTIYISDGGDIDFTNMSSGAIGYAWDFGDGNTSAAMDPMHTYTTAGTYTVTLTADNGEPLCDDMITNTVLVLEGHVGINESDVNGDFSVYQDETNLYLDFDFDATKDVRIEVVNLLGKTVINPIEQEVSNQTVAIKGMERMSAGVYFAVVTYDGQRFTRKIQWSK